MSNERRSLRQFIVTVGLALILMLLFVVPMVQAQGIPKQFLDWAVIKKLTVQSGGATFQSDVALSGSSTDLTVGGDVTVGGDITLTGDGSFDDLTATGNTALGDAAGDTTTVTGDMAIAGLRDGTTGYDYFLQIDGDASGITNGAKTYGLQVTMDRTASYTQTGADIDDAGIKVRVGNYAANENFNTVLRGLDVSARNRSTGNQGTLSGGQISIQTDSGGTTANGVALEVNVTANGTVIDSLKAADFRLFRQAATEATDEYVVRVRNSSTSGNGADAGIVLASDYGGSATTDSMDYGIDMSSAAINTADIRLENGETIDNLTDGTIQYGGFMALEVAATQDLIGGFTLIPTTSFQPITNATGGSITSDTSTAIADGGVTGTILLICNYDAQDVVFKDAANTNIGGDVTLTGGANDCLSLVWTGTDWLGTGMHDN